MNSRLAQDPFSISEFAVGGIALAVVALIAFAGLRANQSQDPSPVALSSSPVTSSQRPPVITAAARDEPSQPSNSIAHELKPSMPAMETSDPTAPSPSGPTVAGLAALDPNALRDYRIAAGLGSGNAPDERAQHDMLATPAPERSPQHGPDALWIQKRLHDLGYYLGSSNGVWGVASRNALRDFKSMNGLQEDDGWDRETEQRLFSRQGIPATNTFVGGWAEDIDQCQHGQDRSSLITISARGAETFGGKCDFRSVKREATSSWRIQARCSGQGDSWNANINLKLSGPSLNWSSEHGAATYVRCLKP